jgi:transmembrane sensor
LLQKMFSKVMAIDDKKESAPVRRMWMRWVAAAVVLFVVCSLWFVVNRKPETGSQKTEVAKMNDVEAPKNTRAVITLADGSRVYLDSSGSGKIAQQNNVDVIRNASGEIVYDAKVREANADLQYNTLSNPRGSKVISLTLSDGTRVWLNSESSLKYSTQFVKNTREVEITGEAYFEVAHNASKPFHVKKGETDITVLGTHFNVNAYDDEESLKVTLLEGSVKVGNKTGSVLIKPGEQARLTPNSKPQTLNPDLEQVMAWKNGRFQFDDADIQTVMKQIGRWYDMQIIYEGAVPKDRFAGMISRYTNLSNVLKILNLSGVNYKIEGNKLTIQTK